MNILSTPFTATQLEFDFSVLAKWAQKIVAAVVAIVKPARNRVSRNTMVEITGNTFPVKNELKAMGARWVAAKKCWTISSEKAEAAFRLVRNAKSISRRTHGFRASGCTYGGDCLSFIGRTCAACS